MMYCNKSIIEVQSLAETGAGFTWFSRINIWIMIVFVKLQNSKRVPLVLLEGYQWPEVGVYDLRFYVHNFAN